MLCANFDPYEEGSLPLTTDPLIMANNKVSDECEKVSSISPVVKTPESIKKGQSS